MADASIRDHALVADAGCWLLCQRPRLLMASGESPCWGMRLAQIGRQQAVLISPAGVLAITAAVVPDTVDRVARYRLDELARALRRLLVVHTVRGQPWFDYRADASLYGRCCLLAQVGQFPWLCEQDDLQVIEPDDQTVVLAEGELGEADLSLPPTLIWLGPGASGDTAIAFYETVLPMAPPSLPVADERAWFRRYIGCCRERERTRRRMHGLAMPAHLADQDTPEPLLDALWPRRYGGIGEADRDRLRPLLASFDQAVPQETTP
jgi:hypothetical protein